jgi:hypothetical protein
MAVPIIWRTAADSSWLRRGADTPRSAASRIRRGGFTGLSRLSAP